MSNPAETVVILTGAAGGIGSATARVLAEKRYRVGLIDLPGPALEAVADRVRAAGAPTAAEAADVRDREGLAAAIGRIEEALGPTDTIVAGAGVGTLSSIRDLDTPGLRSMLDVNVLGVAHTIEAVLPGMIERGRGHIVGISSVAGYRGLPWMPGYSASKAAVSAYLEGLRPALKLRGIRITTVCPGFVRTPMTENTPFRRPVKMLDPAEAAPYLVRAIEKRPRDYVFPLGTAIGMRILRRMPNWLFDHLMDREGPRALTTEF